MDPRSQSCEIKKLFLWAYCKSKLPTSYSLASPILLTFELSSKQFGVIWPLVGLWPSIKRCAVSDIPFLFRK